MARSVEHFLLRGGLDFVSSPLSIDPGRAWRGTNFECVEAGYRRIAGFERFDGRPSPSGATYYVIPVDHAPNEHPPLVGEVLRSGDKTATLLAITDDGDYIIQGMDTGELFADGDPLHVTRELQDGSTLTWQGEVLLWQGQSLTWQ